MIAGTKNDKRLDINTIKSEIGNLYLNITYGLFQNRPRSIKDTYLKFYVDNPKFVNKFNLNKKLAVCKSLLFSEVLLEKKDELINILSQIDLPDNNEIEEYIGLFYYYGYGVKQDYTIAINYFLRAINYADKLSEIQDSNLTTKSDDCWDGRDQRIISRYYLGMCFYYGLGVSQDLIIASKLLEDASNGQWMLYKYFEGLRYLKGECVKKNPIEGFKSIVNIYPHGLHIEWVMTPHPFFVNPNPFSDSSSGDISNYTYHLYEEPLNQIEFFAILGDVYAQFALGLIKYPIKDPDKQGNNCDDSFKGMIKWFSLSYINGLSLSSYFLGLCYKYGLGVVKNEERLFQFMMQSSYDGFDRAFVILGDCYLEGKGVGKNREKAIEYYNKAIDHENQDALIRLGDLYYHYSINEQEKEIAVDCYKKAIEFELIEGFRSLGYCYLLGFGVKKDLLKGISYLDQASSQGDQDASLKLGLMYWKGDSVEKNVEKAFSYFRSSYKLPLANYYLSICYYYGIGTKRSYSSAEYSINHAIENCKSEGFEQFKKYKDWLKNRTSGNMFRQLYYRLKDRFQNNYYYIN